MIHDSYEMVRLYFMRSNGDFVVDIARINDAYKIDVKDTTAADPFKATTVVATYQDLLNYLDVLFQQVLNDLDCAVPFLYFQYNINPFPTVLIPVRLFDYYRYGRFMNALSYHFQEGCDRPGPEQESTAPDLERGADSP